MRASKYSAFQNSTQLETLYQKWKANPQAYGQEMAETVDRIIHFVLGKWYIPPLLEYEDKEDLVSSLRLLCFQKMENIVNPTNKRIFNYLTISINLTLRHLQRKVKKGLTRPIPPFVDKSSKDVHIDSPSLNLIFNDPQTTRVAELLSRGYTREDIRSTEGLSRTEIEKIIEQIKKVVTETNE